jgi:hypothetical protein
MRLDGRRETGQEIRGIKGWRGRSSKQPNMCDKIGLHARLELDLTQSAKIYLKDRSFNPKL